MGKMIISIFERLFESYIALVIEGSRNWAVPIRVLFIPVSIFFYALTLFVIFTILPLVILIAVPISAVSKIKLSRSRD